MYSASDPPNAVYVAPSQEEIEPGLPVSVLSHLIQLPVVLGTVLLEVQAQVEQRLPQ